MKHENAKKTSSSSRKSPGQRKTVGKRNRSAENGSQNGRGSGEAKDSKLEKFFLDQIKDIYYAEQKILKSLPKMKDAATTDELKNAFEEHLHQTEQHVRRLERAFRMLKQNAEGKKCEAIEGIAKEVDEIVESTEEGTMTRDAALIVAAQKVEHYEIATYGGLVQLAITMGLENVADILDKTLMEEEDTDRLLTDIAENDINLGAEQEGAEYSWQKQQQPEEVNA